MRISLRHRKLCYVVATCICLTCAAGVATWATRPLHVGPIATSARPRPTEGGASPTENANEPPHEALVKLCDRPLRKALYDPPPPKVEIKQLPPLHVELLGTIIEENNSMAIVRSEQGSVQYKRVGDALGPPESPANIIEISANSMVVERSQERVTLKVQSKELR